MYQLNTIITVTRANTACDLLDVACRNMRIEQGGVGEGKLANTTFTQYCISNAARRWILPTGLHEFDPGLYLGLVPGYLSDISSANC